MSDDPDSIRRVRPRLTFLHDAATIEANASYLYWNGQPTDAIVDSLKAGGSSPLTAKPDGTIVDGNTRAWILRHRGFDIDTLPRAEYRSKTEDFDG
jgi:hypothetical protein